MSDFRLATITYLASIFPEDTMRYHQGMLPFHCACRAKAPLSMISWWLEEQCPDAIRLHTIDTNDTPLHCYLSPPIRRTAAGKKRHRIDGQPLSESDLSTVEYFVSRYPEALLIHNQSGWLPLYLAALNDAPLDVLFFLTQQSPESIAIVVSRLSPFALFS